MMMRYKFLAALLHNCKFVETDQIPTAAIDKKLNILLNKSFMESLTEEEQLFVIGHELLHACLLHVYRIFEFADPRHYQVGNIAADYLVNFILIEMGMKKPAIVTLHKPEYNPTDYVLESLVKELLKQQQGQQQGQNGQSGQGKGEPSIGDGTDIVEGDGEPLKPEELKAIERKLKSSLASAVMQAKKQGTLPGSLERFCEELLKSKVNWRNELADWFNVKIKGDRNWSRPNKRFVSRGIYSPVNIALGCGHIGIAADLSGSISQKEFDVWWSEMRYIFEMCKPNKVTICWFDTNTSISTFEDEIPDKITIPNMSGGTDFHKPIEFFNDEVDLY